MLIFKDEATANAADQMVFKFKDEEFRTFPYDIVYNENLNDIVIDYNTSLKVMCWRVFLSANSSVSNIYFSHILSYLNLGFPPQSTFLSCSILFSYLSSAVI